MNLIVEELREPIFAVTETRLLLARLVEEVNTNFILGVEPYLSYRKTKKTAIVHLP